MIVLVFCHSLYVCKASMIDILPHYALQNLLGIIQNTKRVCIILYSQLPQRHSEGETKSLILFAADCARTRLSAPYYSCSYLDPEEHRAPSCLVPLVLHPGCRPLHDDHLSCSYCPALQQIHSPSRRLSQVCLITSTICTAISCYTCRPLHLNPCTLSIV